VRRVLTKAAAVGALALLMLSARIVPSTADDWSYYHRYYRNPAGVAYVQAVPDYSACRTGWWQSVRYGHVRPHWAMFCR
jgi:hypothetical protein